MSQNENVGAFIVALLIVGALAGVLILGVRAIADINQAQAEKAYAKAQQAREQTLQVQAYQDAKTERWEAFLATITALTSRPEDRGWIPWLILLALIDVALIIYAIYVRRRTP